MFSPNASFNASSTGTTACAARPCLFNIAKDPNEHDDLADSDPTKAAELLAKFYTYNTEYHPGAPIGSDHDGYCAAAEAHRGFMVPWRTSPASDGRDGGLQHTRAEQRDDAGGDPMEGMAEGQLAAYMAGGGPR